MMVSGTPGASTANVSPLAVNTLCSLSDRVNYRHPLRGIRQRGLHDAELGHRSVGLLGWLTEMESQTTMALVEHGEVLGSRQLDMGNSGSRLKAEK